jgi:hypothetical protein
MLHRVTLVRTDVSEESSVSFIRVTRIGELGTKLSVTSNRSTLRRNTKYYIVLITVFLRSLRRLLLNANVVPSSPIVVFLMMGALRSSQTPVITRVTRCNIQWKPLILYYECFGVWYIGYHQQAIPCMENYWGACGLTLPTTDVRLVSQKAESIIENTAYGKYSISDFCSKIPWLSATANENELKWRATGYFRLRYHDSI